MPIVKYKNDEERLEARRQSAKKYYEKKKSDPKFVEYHRESTKKYNEANREMIAEKSRIYYNTCYEYRAKKLQRSAERWRNDEDFRNRNLKACNERNKIKRLEKQVETSTDDC